MILFYSAIFGIIASITNLFLIYIFENSAFNVESRKKIITPATIGPALLFYNIIFFPLVETVGLTSALDALRFYNLNIALILTTVFIASFLLHYRVDRVSRIAIAIFFIGMSIQYEILFPVNSIQISFFSILVSHSCYNATFLLLAYWFIFKLRRSNYRRISTHPE